LREHKERRVAKRLYEAVFLAFGAHEQKEYRVTGNHDSPSKRKKTFATHEKQIPMSKMGYIIAHVAQMCQVERRSSKGSDWGKDRILIS